MNKIEVRLFVLDIKYDRYFYKTEYSFMFSDILDTVHRSRNVQNLENITVSMKLKRKLVNPKSDFKIKLDSSNLFSATNQQTNVSIMY